MTTFTLKVNLGDVQAKSPKLKQKAVTYISNELLRKSSPYVPHDRGILEGSGIQHSVPNQGKLIWKTPYAEYQWEHGRANGTRGRKWAKRAWLDHRKWILANAQNIMKGTAQV